jgi:PAS domain S-box-containing protein
MPSTLKVLFLEDRPADATLLLHELRQYGYTPEWTRVDTEATYLASLNPALDVILADFSLPQFNALKALKLLRERKLDIPFIVVTGSLSEEAAAECIKQGADDYLLKDRLVRLGQAVAAAVEAKRLRDEARSAEIALRESEFRFRRMAENAPDIIFRYRFYPTPMCEYVSPSATSITGYTPEDYYENPALAFSRLLSEDQSALTDVLKHRDTSRPLILRTLHKDGSLIWLEHRLVLICDEAGHLVELEGISRDITERIRAEQELYRLNRALQILSQCNEALVRATDEIDLLQATCRIVTEIGGYAMAWVGYVAHDPDKTIRPMAFAGDEDGYLSNTRFSWGDNKFGRGPAGTAIRTRKPTVMRVNPPTADFAPWYEAAVQSGYACILALPLLTDTQVIGVLGIFSSDESAFDDQEVEQLTQLADDLAFGIVSLRARAERLRVEEALRESEARLRVIVANVPVILFAFDRDEIITLAEGKGLEQLELTAQDITGRRLRDAFQVQPLIPDDYQRALSGESFGTIIELSNGSTFDVRYSPLLDAHDEVAGVIGVAIDLSERKEAEAARRTAELMSEQLEQEKQLRELKDRFISIASHEFRTPLATILSSASLLEMAEERMSREKRFAHFRKIQLTVRNMNALLEDVLTLSKADADKLEFEPMPLDLEAFCRDMTEEIGQTVFRSHHFFFNATGPCTPAIMDEKLLRQIMNNLLTNAGKYSPQGSTITFNLDCDGTYAVFTVQDQGIGIPANDQERLYETFHRASNVGTIQGTGLGLAITKKAIEKHQGTISFESKLNEGTIFTVRLPLRVDHD